MENVRLKKLAVLIRRTMNSYLAASRSKEDLLDTACGAPWEPKAHELTEKAAVLQRICEGLSRELQVLLELEEKLKTETDKDLKIIIEQVDSPHQPNNSPPKEDTPK